MSEIRRQSNGRFEPGCSGNKNGARARRKRYETPAELHALILQVANSRATIQTRDGVKQVTQIEACVRRIAAGQSKGRNALKDFVDLTKGAAHYFERERAKAHAGDQSKIRPRG